MRSTRGRFLLLVIDPDPAGTAKLHRELYDRQVDVIPTSDPADGLLQTGVLQPDAVLTAADVPPMRGCDVARALHGRTRIPTLVGIAEDDPAEAVRAHAAGAVASIIRPYQLPQVLRVLRALSPDTTAPTEPRLSTGQLCINPATHDVHLRGRRIDMPMREFELLHLLMLHAGRVLTHRQIYHLIWNTDGTTSNTLNVHIKRLRARLGDDAAKPIIVSVRGIGYRLEPPE